MYQILLHSFMENCPLYLVIQSLSWATCKESVMHRGNRQNKAKLPMARIVLYSESIGRSKGLFESISRE